jgi:hypothetical protein
VRPFNVTPSRLFDFASIKPVQDIHNVLHIEIGIERMSEDRVEQFALMVIHGRASLEG